MQKIVLWLMNHPLLVCLVLIYIIMGFWMCRFQKKLKLRWSEIYLVPAVHLIVGYLGARLLALIEVGFVWEKAADLRIFGSAFVVPLIYWTWAKITKRDLDMLMDIGAVNAILGYFSGRANCAVSGCCRGLPIPRMGGLRWPILEVEAVFCLIVLIWAVYRNLKGKSHGELLPLFLAGYGVVRFVLEFAREEFTTQVGPLHLAHIWAIVAIAGGITWYLLNSKKHKKPGKPGKNGRTIRNQTMEGKK